MEHDTARVPGRARTLCAWRERGALAAAAYFVKNLVLRGGLVDGPGGWRFHRLHMRYAALEYRLLSSPPE